LELLFLYCTYVIWLSNFYFIIYW